MQSVRNNGLLFYGILRLAAGILLAGIVFWAISNVFNWMRGSISDYKVKRNRPKPTEEEIQERHINNRKKVRKLIILYLCLCAALVIIIVSADAYF